MPSPTPSLSIDDVQRHVDDEVFTGSATGRVGIELEWLTVARDPGTTPAPDGLRDLLPASLPGGSRVTFEPGGQLELSGPASDDLAGACAAMASDTDAARAALARGGVDLVGVGLDPGGARDRVVDAPRYRAMEEFFDTSWPAGRTMMRNTAAVQVNLDLGDPEDADARWVQAHDLGPVLAASFANSPFDSAGNTTGWCSSRLAVWEAIDPSRTSPVHHEGVDGADAWTRYALDALVMMVWLGPDRNVVLDDPMSFRSWIEHGHPLGWPTLDDLTYHLTTLFPPVRPRGWLELRMIDALPEEWWPVAVAVTTALLDDPDAFADASSAVAPVRDRWTAAARHGLADPALRTAADECFTAARRAMEAVGAAPDTVAATAEYHERYVARGRCPANDRVGERTRRQAAIA